MTDLVQKHCVPCEGGALPLMREESAKLLQETPGWTIAPDGLSLSREFAFKNFVDAMGFANKITPRPFSLVGEGDRHINDACYRGFV
jgi:4a-hydroxytetrahydrobiopterin dehydratase